MNASRNSGLLLGSSEKAFSGNYRIKGCHVEGRVAYFGEGGDEIAHTTTPVEPLYRPNGYDCGALVF